jgi:carbamoylphosphate synthase large subunit
VCVRVKERVLDIYDREKPDGVVVSVGGQQPQNIALALHKAGVKILGTSPLSIDTAEDRSQFSALLDRIGVKQPAWNAMSSIKEAKEFARQVSYPCLVRPSYVLSGAAMKIVSNDQQMEEFLQAAVEVSPDYPVVISKFITGAREVECDAVANRGTLVNWAISEHIEDAGVHSGDATTILPAISIPDTVQAQIRSISEKITRELQVSGPVNIQYLVKDGEVLVIECNLRASRSFPFVSKVVGVDFLRTATRIFMGEDVPVEQKCYNKVPHYGVKAPMFSFQRLLGADPIVGVEMASTGEVACFGATPEEAFLKAVLSSNFKWPKRKNALLANITPTFARQAKDLHAAGYRFFATPESAAMLAHESVPVTTVPLADGDDSALAHIQTKNVDFVVSFPDHTDDQFYPLRRKSVDFGVPIVTDPKVAAMLARSLARVPTLDGLSPDHHDTYLRNTL